MFKLSNMVNAVNALTAEPAAEGPEPFTWTTPIRHDPFLIAQLQRANLELRTLFSIAAQGGGDGAFDAAADALVSCMRNLREVQRLEALRLYPVVAYHAAGNSDEGAAVAYLRLRTHTLARRFLRLSESLITACRAKSASPAAFAEARAALDGYIGVKEHQLYAAYTLAASSVVAAVEQKTA